MYNNKDEDVYAVMPRAESFLSNPFWANHYFFFFSFSRVNQVCVKHDGLFGRKIDKYFNPIRLESRAIKMYTL